MRKREWDEVSADAAPGESVYSSPLASSSPSAWGGPQTHSRRPPPRSSTPRERETPSWVFGGSSAGKSGRDSLGSSAGGRRGHSVGGWRRASEDLGQTAMAAAASTGGASSDSGEDSLGYPLLPCDGRECKIRIVERLGKIKDSRGGETGAGSGGLLEDEGGGGSGEYIQGILAATGGGGEGSSGGGEGPSGDNSNNSNNDGGPPQRPLLGRFWSSSSLSSNRPSLGRGGEIDDTELNELGDSELEGLLEQMWMQVMGQVRVRGWSARSWCNVARRGWFWVLAVGVRERGLVGAAGVDVHRYV